VPARRFGVERAGKAMAKPMRGSRCAIPIAEEIYG